MRFMVADVLNLVTLLKGLPYVDPDRIGMMGHSRGGMMTYLVLKQDCLADTKDIKAAATVGGVAWRHHGPGLWWDARRRGFDLPRRREGQGRAMSRGFRVSMKPRAGIEPATNSLQGCRSATELPRHAPCKAGDTK